MNNLGYNLRFIHLFSRFYNLIWKAALPFLKTRFRLKQGLNQRISGEHLTKADIWIHAASAGEAYLAVEIVQHLYPAYPVKIMISSTTLQGMEILNEKIMDNKSSAVNFVFDSITPSSSVSAAPCFDHDHSASRFRNIVCNITWFPFDMPEIMEKAVSKINPEIMVVLETELWPGLFMALKKRGIEIFIVNARLSYKSYKAYLKTAFFWRRIAPDHILAISGKDKFRFGEIFKNSKIGLMSNIKFDAVCNLDKTLINSFTSKCPSMGKSSDIYKNSLSFESVKSTLHRPSSDNGKSFDTIINRQYPMSILVSIRREEEEDVEQIIKELLSEFPRQVVGVFPRHMHRIEHWKTTLTKLGFPWQLKSKIKNIPECGSIILWDVFGELKQIYPFAVTAFIGGSLKPLGGQNFIESVIRGTATVTGPFTDDFGWVGEDIFQSGLVEKVENWHEVAAFMVHNLKNPCDRYELCKKAQHYIMEKRGGTDAACKKINKIINKARDNNNAFKAMPVKRQQFNKKKDF